MKQEERGQCEQTFRLIVQFTFFFPMKEYDYIEIFIFQRQSELLP